MLVALGAYRLRFPGWRAATVASVVGQWAWAVHMWPTSSSTDSSLGFGVSVGTSLVPAWGAYAALIAASLAAGGAVLHVLPQMRRDEGSRTT
jgi:hypothetical protein